MMNGMARTNHTLRFLLKRKEKKYSGRFFYNISNTVAEAILNNLGRVFASGELDFTYLIDNNIICKEDWELFHTSNKRVFGNGQRVTDFTINKVIQDIIDRKFGVLNTIGEIYPKSQMPAMEKEQAKLHLKLKTISIDEIDYYIVKKDLLDDYLK